MAISFMSSLILPSTLFIIYADEKEPLYNSSFILVNVFIGFMWLDYVVKRKFQDW
jgi:hypothetical protein